MGKQNKSRKPELVGKGKVTPVQVAFIVDRYLSDNNYINTRSTFRSEASHLIAKSPVQEAPKSLLSLGAILDEYITLKEQKVLLDQERCRLEQEKLKLQKLLTGMQDVMNAYNASGNNVVTPPLPLPLPTAMASQKMVQSRAIVPPSDPALMTPAGCYPMYNTSVTMSTSGPSNSQTDPKTFSTPITNQPSGKRKKCKDVSDALVTAKRCSRRIQTKDPNIPPQLSNAEAKQESSSKGSTVELSADDNSPGGSLVHGSNVVKCLFNQNIPSPPANCSVPKTPTRAFSTETDKSISPLVTATPCEHITPQQTDCTIISSETILVSPAKQIAYYRIEKNHCISTYSPVKANSTRSNKDHAAKGRLDFGSSDMPIIAENQTPDGTSTSESDREGNILDLDFPNLDALGLDFNLSELLVDFDLGGEGLDFSSQQATNYTPDSSSGSPHTSEYQVMSHFLSTTKGILPEEANLSGPDSVTTLKSVTKCIKISSPAKKQSSLDPENFSA
ncbi:uncharacterized protein LOC111378124 isoform X2 [Olea europaea var. sylvestris]|uniref:uncharacterized protein LOC111378124 isoform X2 n=1 Tax=Olea europaea var. sylvestris TaxID=158386 RepID=UPI000C1CE97A|nr:uncharacterized protein LOC111378124 isoform X2 [Olea europaea var. sylvestris]